MDIKRYWKLAIAEQVTVGPDTSWSDIVAWLGPDVPVEMPTSEGSWPSVHGLEVRPGCHITKYPYGRVSVVHPVMGVVPPLEAGWTEVYDDPSTTGSAVVSTLFALTGAWVPDGPVHTLSVLVNEQDDDEPTLEEVQAAIDAISGVADVSRGPAPTGIANPPSDGEFLTWAGTNGERWARAFLDRYNVLGVRFGGTFDTVRAWFANAIEAGRTAGYEQANEKDAEPAGLAGMDEPWQFEFARREGERLTPGEAIGQALGAASVCWEHPERAGVFRSEWAEQIAVALAIELGLHDESVSPWDKCAAPDFEWFYKREQERVANLRRVMHAVVEAL